MILQVEVINLVGEDDAGDCQEVEWVDPLIAVLHEEAHDEESEGDSVHENTIDAIEDQPLALGPVLLLLLCDTGVDHQAEGQEERVLGEEVDEEDSMDVAVSELIDGQVEDDEGL